MSLAMLNVVSAPASSASASDLDDLMSFVGFESKVDHVAASLAAGVPEFMRPQRRLSERGSVVRSVACHRDESAARLVLANELQLRLCVASAR